MAAQKQSAVHLAGRARSDQRIRYKVTPQQNALMSCEGIGGQLTALGKLIRSLAREDGLKVHALVGGISMDPDGSINFEIVTVPEVS